MAMNAAVRSSRSPATAATRRSRACSSGVGGGAMLGGIIAFRIVDHHDPLRLGALAWALQAVPLWALAATPAPDVAIAALALSVSATASACRRCTA